jgi:signal transduction histidine kinase
MLLGVFAVDGSRRLQEDVEREERERVRVEVGSTLESWHQRVLSQIQLWLFYLGHESDLDGRETRLRSEYPYFDAFYLWDRTTREILFPRALEISEDEPPSPPCVARAEALGAILPAGAGAMLYLKCLPQPPFHEILATTRAARLFLDDRKPDRARRAIQRGQIPMTMPLRDAEALGVPMAVSANRRLLTAEIHDTLGNSESARRVLVGLGSELAALDGSLLFESLIEISPSVIDALHTLGADTDAADLDSLFERAWRRQDAWTEVMERLSQRPYAPPYHATPQPVRDQYGSLPFLLLHREVNEFDMVGAVQIDETQLLESFLENLRPELRGHVVIVDGAGRRIAGVGSIQNADSVLPTPAPFGYFRVGISSGSLGLLGGGAGQRFLTQVAPVFTAVLLGFLALLARIAADRRQRELNVRQREFVTRVTHELKTPLAGIRVMAEAIEIGAFRDDAERAELCGHIEKETERLADRVEDILRVAREPRDFRPVLLSPVQLGISLAERWRLLMEPSGVDFETDFHPVPDIEAEPRILADALAALLDNALKYRHPDRKPQVRFRIHAEGHRWICFEVVDNGIGVPHSLRRAIFDPFTRVEGPDRGSAGGHGLGLSFVANAARLHRGKAECRDGIDGGSSMVLRLPTRVPSSGWRRFLGAWPRGSEPEIS